MHHQPRDTLSVLPRSISTQVLASNRNIKMYSTQVPRDKAKCGMRVREYKREERKEQREERKEQAPHEQKRVFLRKGSSLQKQIVLNLLKSKMRENAEECSNQEIIKLIRVYRGESENGKRWKGAREKMDRLERGIAAWQSPLEVGLQVGPLLSPLIGG